MNDNYPDLVQFIYSRTTPAIKLDLERVKKFFAALGNPQNSLTVVHIAGTNGKGSTAASIAALLQAAGKKVGLFTSPHLVRINERIRINGQEISDEEIKLRLENWKKLIDKLGITFFEAVTALAVDIFAAHKVDIAVLETGLGGRLDATNIVRPRLSVITRVAHDHTRILGRTLLAIAGEKAGIIKPGVPVVVGRNFPRVVEFLQQRAQQLGSTLFYAPRETPLRPGQVSIFKGQEVIWHNSSSAHSWQWPLLGSHQVDNLATAITAVRQLIPSWKPEFLTAAAAVLHWPGRMELLSRRPAVLYDVAHNANGVAALVKTLQQAKLGEAVLLGGLNRRKRVRPILKQLRRWQGPVGLFASTSEFGCSLEDYAQLDGSFPHFANLASALHWARQLISDDSPIVIFGSHYIATEVYGLFKKVSPVDLSF